MGHHSKKLKKLKNLNKQQRRALRSVLGGLSNEDFQITNKPLYSAGESYLKNLLSQTPSSSQQEYETYSKPMMDEFQQQIMPGLEEHFAGLGAGSSSGFQQTLAAAQNTLQNRLAALKMGLGREREESLLNRQMQAVPMAGQYSSAPASMAMGRAGLGLGTSPFSYMQPAGKAPGAMASFFGGAGPGLGAGLGFLAGNMLFPGVGGMVGAGIGAGLGSGASSMAMR